MGAKPSGGSQRRSPACSLGKTRTTTGRTEHVDVICSLYCFSPRCLPMISCCLDPPQEFDPHHDVVFFWFLPYWLCLHSHWAASACFCACLTVSLLRHWPNLKLWPCLCYIALMMHLLHMSEGFCNQSTVSLSQENISNMFFYMSFPCSKFPRKLLTAILWQAPGKKNEDSL